MATNLRDSQKRDAIHNEIHNEIHDEVHNGAPHARTVNHLGETPGAETVSSAHPAGGSGVSVYERNPAQPIDPTLRPAASPIMTDSTDDRMLVEPRSTGSVVGWIIGAVILIILAYFLLQMIF
jgi:hypothetical protein